MRGNLNLVGWPTWLVFGKYSISDFRGNHVFILRLPCVFMSEIIFFNVKWFSYIFHLFGERVVELLNEFVQFPVFQRKFLCVFIFVIWIKIVNINSAPGTRPAGEGYLGSQSKNLIA